jgi:hypothetical protein
MFEEAKRLGKPFLPETSLVLAEALRVARQGLILGVINTLAAWGSSPNARVILFGRSPSSSCLMSLDE